MFLLERNDFSVRNISFSKFIQTPSLLLSTINMKNYIVLSNILYIPHKMIRFTLVSIRKYEC